MNDDDQEALLRSARIFLLNVLDALWYLMLCFLWLLVGAVIFWAGSYVIGSAAWIVTALFLAWGVILGVRSALK